MESASICCAGITPAMTYVRRHLLRLGYDVTDTPGWNTGHLILDIPTFRPGFTRLELDTLLSSLPGKAVIWGGNLDDSATERAAVDLLRDERYLARNGAITADCALMLAAPLLNTAWRDTKAIVIGWGRIGKCLARQLKALGCPVTVAARREADRAALESLGYGAISCEELPGALSGTGLIFNTVPHRIITREQWPRNEKIVALDLASEPGMEGSHVIQARGLPGIHAPESAGRLIAETFLRKWKEELP